MLIISNIGEVLNRKSGYPAGANEVLRRSVQWDKLAVLLFAIGGKKLAPKALGFWIYIDLIGLYLYILHARKSKVFLLRNDNQALKVAHALLTR